MIISEQDFKMMDRIERINTINALSGIKSVNLLGTISNSGNTNLAIFNSVFHIGSNPPLLGFILRPETERRDTLRNILDTGYFTINHVHESFIENAHYTSAKFSADISEFDACSLTPHYFDGFVAPFVKESRIKMAMEFIQQIALEVNGTSLIIGKILFAIIADEAIMEQAQLDLSMINDVGISGLNTYYSIKKIAQFPYARPNQLPEFK